MTEPRITASVAQVLAALLHADGQPRYGAQLVVSTGLPLATVYQLLGRLEDVGWLTSEVEDVDPRRVGRPVRRYYRLAPEAVGRARLAVEAMRARLDGPQP